MSEYCSTLERWQVFVSDAVAAIFSICVLILHLLLCSYIAVPTYYYIDHLGGSL